MTGKLKIKEIAAQTGVSISTVSRILSGQSHSKPEIKEAVLKFAQTQGVLAKMSHGPYLFNNVTIFAPAKAFDVRTDIFYYNVMKNLREAAASHTFRINACVLDEQNSDLPAFLKKIGDPACETTILLGIDDPRVHEIASEIGKPCVLINGRSLTMRLDTVSPDHALIGEFSAHYLVEQGHSRILVLICLCRETMEDRLLGIRKALGARKISFDETRQLVVTTGFGMEEAHEAIATYFARHPDEAPPTAILAGGDFMAAGAYEALSQRGIAVPADISILSMDSVNLTEIGAIPLTAVRIPRKELALTALRLLQQRLASPSAPFSTVLLGGELLVRDSVKRFGKRKSSANLQQKTFALY